MNNIIKGLWKEVDLLKKKIKQHREKLSETILSTEKIKILEQMLELNIQLQKKCEDIMLEKTTKQEYLDGYWEQVDAQSQEEYFKQQIEKLKN